MKCQRCQDSLGKDVNMEALGGGQHQCPDCRAVVLPAPPAASAPEPTEPVADPLPDSDMSSVDSFEPPPPPNRTIRKR